MFETPLTVVGRVITEVTLRTLSNGDKKCSFRIMSSERKFNRERQEWEDGERLFLQVNCWRRLAENVSASVFRGDDVVVMGRLYLNEYEVNGEARSMMLLDARAVGPDLARCTAMVQRPLRESVTGDAAVTAGALAA